jgi:hypothetical protein
MCKCEFCNSYFTPRAQVKKPRACQKKECQLKRQRANEKAWKEQQGDRFDAKYHNKKKQKRLSNLRDMAGNVIKCIETGLTFLGKSLNIEKMRGYITELFYTLGSRRVNKLWA